MLGQIVLDNDEVNAGTKAPMTIDISSVPSGIYIYRITTENEEVIEGKVVKM